MLLLVKAQADQRGSAIRKKTSNEQDPVAQVWRRLVKIRRTVIDGYDTRNGGRLVQKRSDRKDDRELDEFAVGQLYSRRGGMAVFNLDLRAGFLAAVPLLHFAFAAICFIGMIKRKAFDLATAIVKVQRKAGNR
jgi:hypothetical protein